MKYDHHCRELLAIFLRKLKAIPAQSWSQSWKDLLTMSWSESIKGRPSFDDVAEILRGEIGLITGEEILDIDQSRRTAHSGYFFCLQWDWLQIKKGFVPVPILCMAELFKASKYLTSANNLMMYVSKKCCNWRLYMMLLDIAKMYLLFYCNICWFWTLLIELDLQ